MSGSLGAARVRESFNPSQDGTVDKIKRHTADLIDLCNNASAKDAFEAETSRLWALAMTDYERAAMWATKAATSERGLPANPQPGVGTKQPDRD